MMTMAQCIFTLLYIIVSTLSFINSNCSEPTESLTVLGEKEADATMESTNEMENSNQSQDSTDCDVGDKETPQFSLPTPTTSIDSEDEESEEESEIDNDNNGPSTQANPVVTDLLKQFDEARRDEPMPPSYGGEAPRQQALDTDHSSKPSAENGPRDQSLGDCVRANDHDTICNRSVDHPSKRDRDQCASSDLASMNHTNDETAYSEQSYSEQSPEKKRKHSHVQHEIGSPALNAIAKVKSRSDNKYFEKSQI
jgi:hypothetical protein